MAEEVEKVNPDLVVRDKEGKPCSVRFDAVNAMLLMSSSKHVARLTRSKSKMMRLLRAYRGRAAGSPQ